MGKKEKPKKIIGLDYGQSKIGVAVSDNTHMIAFPLSIIQAAKKMAQTVQNVVSALAEIEKEHECVIEKVVVGLPLKLSGKASMMSDEVTLFIEELKEVLSIPILAWDERMTTILAENSLKEGGMNRKKRAKIVDTISASLVLQSYLDFEGSKHDNKNDGC